MDRVAFLTFTLALASALALPAVAAPPGGIAGQLRVGEQTVLGAEAPESFTAYDLRAWWPLPVERPLALRLRLGTRLLASAGLFEGAGQTAAVVSAIPLATLGTAGGRWLADAGAGLALLSEHRYAEQDFGGPLQFALTAGLEAPLWRRLGIGYRFMHYSDAGGYGEHTIGADLHMLGLSWRF